MRSVIEPHQNSASRVPPWDDTAPMGVLTHLGVDAGEVEFTGIMTKVEHGLVLGNTVARSIEMAREAGLNLSIVEP